MRRLGGVALIVAAGTGAGLCDWVRKHADRAAEFVVLSTDRLSIPAIRKFETLQQIEECLEGLWSNEGEELHLQCFGMDDEKKKNLAHHLEKVMKNAAVLHATMKVQGRDVVKNSLANLKRKFKPLTTRGVRWSSIGAGAPHETMCVVGAGPSLEKKYEDIKSLQVLGVPVVAVDVACAPLSAHGITPDVMVSIDTHADPKLVPATKYKRVICAISSPPDLLDALERAGNLLTLACVQGAADAWLYNRLGVQCLRVNPGGSAFNLGVGWSACCGASQIVMIGNDLCYDADKRYAEGVNANDAGTACRRLPGGKIAPLAYLSYKQWLEESLIPSFPGVRFVNESVGGLEIAGTVTERAYPIAIDGQITEQDDDDIDVSEGLESIRANIRSAIDHEVFEVGGAFNVAFPGGGEIEEIKRFGEELLLCIGEL